MSVFSDLVVADGSVFEDTNLSYEASCNWKNANGLTINMLVSLHCLVLKKRFSKALYKQFPSIEPSMGTSVINKMPNTFVDALADLTTERTELITKQWFDEEQEFSSLRVPFAVAQRNLLALIELSRKTRSTNESIFIVSKR